MSDKAEQALATTLTRLTVATTLSRPQAEAVAQEFAFDYTRLTGDGEGFTRSSMLSEVGGYIGAAFVVAAATALVAPNWEDFSAPVRVAILAGPAILLLVCGLLLARTTPGGWSFHPGDQAGPRRRLIGVLTLAAGGLLAGVAAVVTGQHAARGVPLTLLAVWGIGYLLCRGAVLQLATASALLWSILAVVNPSSDHELRVAGAALVLAGAGWAIMTVFGLLDERDLGIALAGAMAFIGAQLIVSAGPAALGYLLLILLAGLGLAGYLRSRQLSALGVGTVSLAVVVPQAVIDYTEGSFGAAGALLLCGLSIVAASALGMRLHASASTPPPPPIPPALAPPAGS
jgi:hypothetical protein